MLQKRSLWNQIKKYESCDGRHSTNGLQCTILRTKCVKVSFSGGAFRAAELYVKALSFWSVSALTQRTVR